MILTYLKDKTAQCAFWSLFHQVHPPDANYKIDYLPFLEIYLTTWLDARVQRWAKSRHNRLEFAIFLLLFLYLWIDPI